MLLVKFKTQIASSAECTTFSRYWEVGDVNVAGCTAAATQTAQQDSNDGNDDSSGGCKTNNGQGVGLVSAWGIQKDCNPDAIKPGNGNGSGNNGGGWRRERETLKSERR